MSSTAPWPRANTGRFGWWSSLVGRVTGGHEIAGPNPAHPTLEAMVEVVSTPVRNTGQPARAASSTLGASAGGC